LTLVVGTAAGGGLDAATRVIARKMSEVLGQSVIVENKGSSAEILAISNVAKVTPLNNSPVLSPRKKVFSRWRIRERYFSMR